MCHESALHIAVRRHVNSAASGVQGYDSFPLATDNTNTFTTGAPAATSLFSGMSPYGRGVYD